MLAVNDTDPSPKRPQTVGARTLALAFCLVGAFTVVELAAGYLSGSLSLVAEAGHMATDAAGLGVALSSAVAGTRGVSRRDRSDGPYLFEITAALAASLLLFALAGYVVYAAIARLWNPVDVAAVPMLLVAAGGFGVNVAVWRLLRPLSRASPNVAGAYVEMLGDLIASGGVIFAALVIVTTGWEMIDALVAVGVGLLIVPRAFRVARKAIRILAASVPPNATPETVAGVLGGIAGVVDVRDVRLRILTSGMDVATAHLVVRGGIDRRFVADEAYERLRYVFGIDHAAFEVEPEGSGGR